MNPQAVTARFNYTSRKKIEQESIKVEFGEVDGRPVVSASIIDPLVLDGLPAESPIILEVSRRTTLEQFRMGTVGATVSVVDASFNEFTNVAGAQARLKVVSAASEAHGRLLAVAEGIQVVGAGSQPGESNPLILFRPSTGLNQEVWFLDLEEEIPTVLLNESIDDWFGLATSSMFVAFVYPELVRRVALWVAADFDAADEAGTVRARWVRFLNRLGTPLSEIARDEGSAVAAWADECASSFSIRHGLVTKLTDAMEA
jgi:hypothetical protein